MLEICTPQYISCGINYTVCNLGSNNVIFNKTITDREGNAQYYCNQEYWQPADKLWGMPLYRSDTWYASAVSLNSNGSCVGAPSHYPAI